VWESMESGLCTGSRDTPHVGINMCRTVTVERTVAQLSNASGRSLLGPPGMG
jgi:hypothetical protein